MTAMTTAPRNARPKRTGRRSIARPLVTVAALAVGAIAMFGSAASLSQIGQDDNLAQTWTLFACLDALALVCVAARVFAGQDNRWVRWGPRLGYGASGALQVTAALVLGPTVDVHGDTFHYRAPFTHMAALVAAAWLAEVVMTMWAPEPATAASAQRTTTPATPERSEPAKPAPEPAPAEEAVIERRPALAVVDGMNDDEIAAQVDAWLAAKDRSPSKASVQDAGRALGLSCRNSERALAIANLVRSRRAQAS